MLECFTCWEDFLDYLVGSYFLYNTFGFWAGQVPNFLCFCSLYSETGWLRSLGARDIAGAGMVHMLGGFSGLIGSYFVGNTYDFMGSRVEFRIVWVFCTH